MPKRRGELLLEDRRHAINLWQEIRLETWIGGIWLVGCTVATWNAIMESHNWEYPVFIWFAKTHWIHYGTILFIENQFQCDIIQANSVVMAIKINSRRQRQTIRSLKCVHWVSWLRCALMICSHSPLLCSPIEIWSMSCERNANQ